MANNLSFSVRLELLADKFRQQAEGAKKMPYEVSSSKP